MIWLNDQSLLITHYGIITYPKGGTIRDSNGQVCKDGEKSISSRRFECKIVRNLMDSQEQILVCSGADNVRSKEELP
jgi:hypothetical protein